MEHYAQQLQEDFKKISVDAKSAEDFWISYFGKFRQNARYALFRFWPNNPGVSDWEIIDAIERLVNENQELKERLMKTGVESMIQFNVR